MNVIGSVSDALSKSTIVLFGGSKSAALA